MYTVRDLEREARVDLARMSNDDAVDLGLATIALVRELELSLAIEVVLGDDTAFRAKLGTTGPDDDRWLCGKAAAVRIFGESSLLVRLRHAEAGKVFSERTDVDHETVCAKGGSVPLLVRGALAGTLTVAGQPDVIDHQVATEALRRYTNTRRGRLYPV